MQVGDNMTITSSSMTVDDDEDDTSGPPMSLSRRFLSLPQELTGSSLPPKVSGKRCGTVTLCIAHILPSAVSSAVLPRVSLVRVRWWGEETPGSLFRPTLLSGDGGAQETEDVDAPSPTRAIAMKYPVCVLPEQLLEYFQDMQQLTLDVIDRGTRRKYGECSLPLDLHSSNNVMTAEEKLVALRQDNLLCEIRPSESGDPDVLGYLAVSFDVQWEHSEIQRWRGIAANEKRNFLARNENEQDVSDTDVQFSVRGILPTASLVDVNSDEIASDTEGTATPHVQRAGITGERIAASSLASSALLASKNLWIDFVDSEGRLGTSRRLSSGFAAADYTLPVANKKHAPAPNRKKSQEVDAPREVSADLQRIRRLLEKGKALQQLMEIAVKHKEDVDTQELDGVVGDTAPGLTKVAEQLARKQVGEAILFDDPYVSFADKWDGEPIVDEYPPHLSTSMQHVQHVPRVGEQDQIAASVNTGLNPSLLKEINALMLTFELLELEHEFVDRQLRQLRDSSSVSSRFSPIQIRVSHGDVASLLFQNSDRADLPEVPAFSVTTSLRKRQWHLKCSSTMPLAQPTSLTGITASKRHNESNSNKRNAKRLRFFVRCENQSDTRRNKRRNEQNLFPRPSRCVLLEGAVDAVTLFSIAGKADSTWTTKVPLFVAGDDTRFDKSEATQGIHQNVRDEKMSRKKKELPVGFLTVKFAFYEKISSGESFASEIDRAEGESESEPVLSSISSSSYEETRHQQQQNETESGSFISARAVSRLLHKEVNSRVLPKAVLKHHKDELRDSGLFHFAVMFETLSTVRSAVWDNGCTKSHGRSSSAVTDGRKCGDHDKSLELPHIALHYVVPSQFTSVSSAVNKFERTVRRKLKGPRWLEHAPRLSADFSGQIHVFQSSFAEDASKYFSNGYMIVEAWLHTSKDTDRTLLGLSKLPLRKFTKFLRSESPGLRGFSEQTLPFVGVDDVFQIENPFTGHQTGFLRARVCVGTAEQLLALATTIQAIIKLQAVVRGVLYRKRFIADHFDETCLVCGFHSNTAIVKKTEPHSVKIKAAESANFELQLADVNDNHIGDNDAHSNGDGADLIARSSSFPERENGLNLPEDHTNMLSARSADCSSASDELEAECDGGEDDDGRGSNGGDSGSETLEINADYFESVTLTLFGINEIQVSPLSEDKVSLDENDEETISDSVATSPEPCGESLAEERLERDGVTSETLTDKLDDSEEQEQENGTASADSPQAEIETGDNAVNCEIPGEEWAPDHVFWGNAGKVQVRSDGSSPVRPRLTIAGSVTNSAEPSAGVVEKKELQLGETTFGTLAGELGLPPLQDVGEFQGDNIGGLNDKGNGFNGGDPDINSLETNFDSVTLASFGIEEMELSPIVQDESSLEEIREETLSRATTISPRSCDGELKSKKLQHREIADDALELASELDQCVVVESNAEHDQASEGVSANDSQSSCPVFDTGESDDDTGSWQVADEQHVVEIALFCESDTVTELGTRIEERHSGSDKEDSIDFAGSTGNKDITSDDDEMNSRDSLLGSPDEASLSMSSTSLTESGNDASSGVVASDSDDDEDVEADHSEVGDALTPSSDNTVVKMNQKTTSILDNTVTNTSTDAVSCEKKSEDTSCANGAASSECVTSILATEKSTERAQLQSAAMCNCHGYEAIQFVDKAIQVDPYELGAQVEVAPPNLIQTACAINLDHDCGDTTGHSDDEVSSDGRAAPYEKSTVDVGCDAIAAASIPGSGEINHQLEDEALQAALTVEQELPVESEDVVKLTKLNGSGVVDTPSGKRTLELPLSDAQTRKLDTTQSLTHIAPTHTSQQTEKLEKVYEMLREMRDCYFSRPLTEQYSSAGDSKYHVDSREDTLLPERKTNIIQYETEKTDSKRCKCPALPLASAFLHDKNAERALTASIDMRPHEGSVHITRKSSSQLQVADERLRSSTTRSDSKKSPNALRTSLRSTGETRGYSGTANIGRLSSSDAWGLTKRPQSKVVIKDEHSLAYSLFAHDSETERIARIMQGSMNYWMKDDSSSGYDDEGSDEEETDYF